MDEQPGKIVCCVCKKFIRDDPRLKPGEISHGYCPACFAEAMRAVDEATKKLAEKKIGE